MNTPLKYRQISSVFMAALMIVCFCALSGQNAAAGVSDDPPGSESAPLMVRDTLPPQPNGLSTSIPMAGSASFAVLISSTYGIDLTDSDSIRFRIDDEELEIYERDLSADSIRVVKLNDDDDSRATLFWAIYDRSREVDIPAVYAADAIISIGVDIRDGVANVLAAGEFNFIIESLAISAKAAQSLPQTAALDFSDPLLTGDYDRGTQVVAGPLKGAKILYSSLEPMPPVIGPILETDGVEADGVEASGPSLNLKPDTVFNTPVRIFLPVADDVETDNLGVYFHNGLQWQPGCNPNGVVADAGLGWMRSESRVILENHDPILIGIDVHHSSATQTVIFAQFNGDRDDDNSHSSSGGTVYVSCFITAAAGQSPIALSVLLIIFVIPASIYSLKKIIDNYSRIINNYSRIRQK